MYVLPLSEDILSRASILSVSSFDKVKKDDLTYQIEADNLIQTIDNGGKNKILICGYVQISIAGPQHNIGVLLNKDGTIIDGYRGDGSGSRTRNGTVGHNMPDGGYDNYTAAIHFNYLDTGGSTSAITYGVSVRNPSGSARTIYMNRANTDTDNQYHYRTASTITVMEIKV